MLRECVIRGTILVCGVRENFLEELWMSCDVLND